MICGLVTAVGCAARSRRCQLWRQCCPIRGSYHHLPYKCAALRADDDWGALYD